MELEGGGIRHAVGSSGELLVNHGSYCILTLNANTISTVEPIFGGQGYFV